MSFCFLKTCPKQRQGALQKEVKAGAVKIKKIGTVLNFADLNTKKLCKSRRDFLLHLIGAVESGGPDGNYEMVGKNEFEAYLNKKAINASLKRVRKVVLKDLLNGVASRVSTTTTTALTTLALNLPRAEGGAKLCASWHE